MPAPILTRDTELSNITERERRIVRFARRARPRRRQATRTGTATPPRAANRRRVGIIRRVAARALGGVERGLRAVDRRRRR